MKTKKYKVGKCTFCGNSDTVLLTEETQDKIGFDGVLHTNVVVTISRCGFCKKENTLKRFQELNK